jgi:Ca2+-transporting ATPase
VSRRRTVPPGSSPEIDPEDRGLTSPEAADRLRLHGPNAIVEASPGRLLALLRETAADPMLWFLAVTALLYLGLGRRGDALVLALALVPLAGMDAWLHRRTRASTEGLASRLAPRARVVRDGRVVELPALEVVPGDLALVGASEPFPADGVVVSGDGLQVDESVLSGEAFPVVKRASPAPPPPPDGGPMAAYRPEHCVFAGTRLLTGRAAVRITRTGGETLYGAIVGSARAVAARTPLQSAIARLVGIATAAAAFLCLLLAVVRLRQGEGWADAVVSAVTLAVAALPEEFPVVFAVFLGVGVVRLARRRALVRRAVSVENIGRVSCICTDKTGTITEGRLRVERLLPAAGLSEDRLLGLAALAARDETGDPLDAAILEAAAERGAADPGARVLATFPFTEDRRRETALVAPAGGGRRAVVKGSPEAVFGMCVLTGSERRDWEARFAGLAADGHKVIACAWRDLPARAAAEPGAGEPKAGEPGPSSDGAAEPAGGYRLVGLLACGDTVREGVRAAVRDCRAAGIHVLMLTGDHPATALAVARRVGLGNGEPRVLEGAALDGGLEAAGAALLRRTDVIARARPAQKLAVVRALQEDGDIVAVTGDGVNDVPAIQAADIGIAMGGRGTRSAREVASIVLLDDDFRSIVRAVAEGRQLFLNLKASFLYLLAIHVPLVLTATLVPLLGYPLLYLPIHIAWLEMLIHPSAMLGFQEEATDGPMEPLPRGRRARLIDRGDALRVAACGLLVALAVTFGYLRALGADADAGSAPGADGDVGHARAFALMILAAAGAAMVAALGRLRTTAARIIAPASLLGSLLLVQVEPLAGWLHLVPLDADDLALALLGGAAPALLLLRGRRGAASC